MNRFSWSVVLGLVLVSIRISNARVVQVFPTTERNELVVPATEGNEGILRNEGMQLKENNGNTPLGLLDDETKEKIKDAFWKKLFNSIEEEIEQTIWDEFTERADEEEQNYAWKNSGEYESLNDENNWNGEEINENENAIWKNFDEKDIESNEEAKEDAQNTFSKEFGKEVKEGEEKMEGQKIKSIQNDPLKPFDNGVKGNSLLKNREEVQNEEKDEADFDDTLDEEETAYWENSEEEDDQLESYWKLFDDYVLERVPPYSLDELSDRDNSDEESLKRESLSWKEESKEQEDDNDDDEFKEKEDFNEETEEIDEEDEENGSGDSDEEIIENQQENPIGSGDGDEEIFENGVESPIWKWIMR